MLNSRIEISASAMCFDWKNVGIELEKLISGGVDYLHFDLIDGLFAPDFGIGTSVINSIRNEVELPADYHLMVENPSRIFETLTIKKGDLVTIHQEACKNLHRDILELKRLGARVGVALNPATHIYSLDYVIEELDHVLIMTVNPGFKGQNLVEQTLPKIQDMKRLLESIKSNASIGVDGNVSLKNIPRMIQGGANYLVGGSSGLFIKNEDLTISLERFREAINAAER
jgi:ribulose-phosphate 3-epimerase